MKAILHCLILIPCCILLLTTCAKDDPYPYAEERRAMADSTQIGFYKEGKALIRLNEETEQYYCNPAAGIFRIQSLDGKERTTLRLSNIPTEKQKVNGRIEGNMGVEMGQVTQLYVLKRNEDFVWLWSDEDRVAVVIPNLGFGS